MQTSQEHFTTKVYAKFGGGGGGGKQSELQQLDYYLRNISRVVAIFFISAQNSDYPNGNSALHIVSSFMKQIFKYFLKGSCKDAC